MNKKLKICHIITRMIVGGAQENTLLSALGQIELGHDVTLLTGPSPGPEGELLKKKGSGSLRTVVFPELVREISPLEDFRAFRRIRFFLAAESFDLVHTHSSKAGIIGRAAAAGAKTPAIVHTVHGQAFHKYEKWWKNFIYARAEKWAAARSDKIFAVCQAMIDQCVSAGVAPESKYKVVYSGMELDNYLNSKPDESLRARLGIPQDAPIVVAVARLFPLKGYEYFVPAAAMIAAKIPKTHFLVVGDGILTDKVKSEAKRLNLNFVFAGLVPPDEIWRYCSIADLLMHLSLREGLARALVQAMASAKPVISFDLDGSPEIVIPGKTGFLARPESSEDAAAAAIEILGDRDLARRLGEQGRELVKERFDWRKMCKILETEYFKCLEKRQNPQTSPS